MNLKPKVRILTSSHKANDDRIFHKQAKSIAGAGYDTAIIAPHRADEILDGIRIKAIKKVSGKLGKAILTPLNVLAAAVKEKADVYHFHDPELIPVGIVLRFLGSKVIYDSHEYYKLKIMSRKRIPAGFRQIIALIYDFLETLAGRTFSGIITTDRVTEEKFKGMAVTVSNPPYKGSISARPKKTSSIFKCVYIGGLEEDRGLFKMVEAMELVSDQVRLVLAGPMSEEDHSRMKRFKGYSKVDYLGFIPWEKVLELLPGCDAGLILIQPVPGYLYHGENSIKLFEYMMAGLPVLGSNFVNLEKIIMENECGLTVDPTSPARIAEKIMYLANNPELCRKMGANGVKAVMEKYNWEKEGEKLLALYDRILNPAVHKRCCHA